jgi:hypothetical protein
VSEPKPISLSDDQTTAILAGSAPLQPIDHSAFLASVAHYFRGRSEGGHGELHRCIAELQNNISECRRSTRHGRRTC